MELPNEKKPSGTMAIPENNNIIEHSIFELLQHLEQNHALKDCSRQDIESLFDQMQMTSWQDNDLAKWLRRSIEIHFKPIIDLELNEIDNINHQIWNIEAHNITKKIRNSDSMNHFMKNIEQKIDQGIYKILNKKTSEEEVLILEENNEQLVNLNNEMDDFALIRNSSNKWKQIVKNLSNLRNLSTKIHTLQYILQSRLSELTTNEFWPPISRSLRENLFHPQEEVYNLVFRIFSKFASSSSPNLMKHGFLNLGESIVSHYTRKRKGVLPTARSGVNMANISHHQLVRCCHLTLEVAKELPSNWARLGEAGTDMLTSWFGLLSMHTFDRRPSIYLSPYMLICLLDPNACWAKVWLHGFLSRDSLLRLMPGCPTLVRYMLETIFVYQPSEDKLESNSLLDYHLFDRNVIEFAVFTHSLNFFSQILRFSRGHSLFPITIPSSEQPITIELFISHLIKKFTDKQSIPILFDIFQTLLSTNCASLFTIQHLDELFESLMNQDLELIQQKQLLDLLIVFIKNNSLIAKEYLLSVYLPHSFPGLAIAKLTDHLLKMNIYLNFEIILKLFEICGLLFTTPTGFVNLENSDSILIETIIEKYQEMILQDLYQTTEKEVFICTLEKFLGLIGSTPLGNLKIIIKCRCLDHLLKSWLRRDGNMNQIPWLTITQTIINAKKEQIHLLLTESNSLFEKEIQSLTEAYYSGMIKKQEESTKQIVELISYFSIDVKVLDHLVNLFTNSTSSILCNLLQLRINEEESLQLTILIILKILATNFNIWLFLEANFNVQTQLLEFQKERFHSEDDTNIIILDEFTIMRHEILLATLQINNKKFLQDNQLIENTKDLFKSIIENIDEGKNKNKNCIVIDYPKDGTDFELYLNRQPVYFIEDLRKEFYHSCKYPIKPSNVIKLIENITAQESSSHLMNYFNFDLIHDINISKEQFLAIDLIVNYGYQMKLLNDIQSNSFYLSQLIKMSKALCNNTSSTQFDWFLATVFLLCEGDVNKCASTLIDLSSLSKISILWPSIRGNRTQLIDSVIGQKLDLIVSWHFPNLHSLLKDHNLSWWIITRTWMIQCYYNYLPWTEIVNWFTLCLFEEPDVIIYYQLALLKHLEKFIIEKSIYGELTKQIKMYPIWDFRLANYIEFIDELIKEYRIIILENLTL